MGETIRDGGCLCGAVRYRIGGEPLGAEYCHCGMCRRQTGAPVAGWVDVPLRAFRWLRGQPREFPSSPAAQRGFCGDCGSPLFFRWRDNEHKLSIALGSLDQPGSLPPGQHIFHADRLPWLVISDDLPRFDAAAPDS